MTEEELVQAFRAVLIGERQRIQKAAKTKSPRQLYAETHGARQIFRYIHPEGAFVVDQWISEAQHDR
jgi:hypothetical protein